MASSANTSAVTAVQVAAAPALPPPQPRRAGGAGANLEAQQEASNTVYQA